jgi:hypothetical protein
MNQRFIEIPNMSLWSQSIGGLIINFGIIEFQSLRWIQKLAGDTAAQKARGDKLSRRIQAAMALVAGSSLSPVDQTRARNLWAEASDHSKTRNRIAHNPICVGRTPNSNEAVLSIIDLKKMAPISDNPLEPLDYSQIASIALRVREVGRELSALIESIA